MSRFLHLAIVVVLAVTSGAPAARAADSPIQTAAVAYRQAAEAMVTALNGGDVPTVESVFETLLTAQQGLDAEIERAQARLRVAGGQLGSDPTGYYVTFERIDASALSRAAAWAEILVWLAKPLDEHRAVALGALSEAVADSEPAAAALAAAIEPLSGISLPPAMVLSVAVPVDIQGGGMVPVTVRIANFGDAAALDVSVRVQRIGAPDGEAHSVGFGEVAAGANEVTQTVSVAFPEPQNVQSHEVVSAELTAANAGAVEESVPVLIFETVPPLPGGTP